LEEKLQENLKKGLLETLIAHLSVWLQEMNKTLTTLLNVWKSKNKHQITKELEKREDNLP
jgi:hypothetical protein